LWHPTQPFGGRHEHLIAARNKIATRNKDLARLLIRGVIAIVWAAAFAAVSNSLTTNVTVVAGDESGGPQNCCSSSIR
jgi:hypothetical protein